MKILRYFPIALSFLLLAAHFSRADLQLFMILSLLIPFILFIKKPWAARLIQICLIIGAVEWIRTILNLINVRTSLNEDWSRMAIILGVVALFTLLSAFIIQTKAMKKIYKHKI